MGIAPGDIYSYDNRASFACHQTGSYYDDGSDLPLNESGYANTYRKNDCGCDMNAIGNVTQSSDIEGMNVISNDFHIGHMILTWIADDRKSQTLICSDSFCMNENVSCCCSTHDCTFHGTEIDYVMIHPKKLLHVAEAAVFVAVAGVVVVVVAVVAAAAAVVSSFSSFLNLMCHSHCLFWGPWVVMML